MKKVIPIILNIIQPFGVITGPLKAGILIFWCMLFLLLFEVFHSPIIPPPSKIFSALVAMIQTSEFIDNLIISFTLTIKAMLYSIIITMIVVYCSTIPLLKPIAIFISKCRYLTMTGVIYLFTVLTSNVGNLKLSLLIFGIVPFFVTSYLEVVNSIPQDQLNKAYVNKKNQWGTLIEVVIIGRLDQLFEVMRQNFAISWMMITMVEGYAMSEGGIGTMLIKSGKYLNLAPVFAMLIVVLLIGILFDFGLTKLRFILFPYIQPKK